MQRPPLNCAGCYATTFGALGTTDEKARQCKLRMWRNAADKLDDAKWIEEGGPSRRDAAEQYLAQLSADIEQLR